MTAWMTYLPRKLLLVTLQASVIASSFLMAHLLRFDGRIPDGPARHFHQMLPMLVLVKGAVFWRSGLCSGWWRFVSLPDLMIILRGNLLASIAFLAAIVASGLWGVIPGSVLVLDGIICFLAVSGLRVLVRVCRESCTVLRKERSPSHQHVLVVGAGAAGQTIVREVRQSPGLNMEVVGFLDADHQRRHASFQGVPVLGAPADLEKVCRARAVNLVVVAQQAVGRRELRAIVEACRRLQVRSKILPTVEEIINGAVSVRHLRDVRVEDLLGRKPVCLDREAIRNYLQGKRILVTGAGGSIGSEICRQVATFDPDVMVLLDHSETPLFHVERELRQRSPGFSLFTSLTDIRDPSKVSQVFSRFRPEVVFHAAAYKHVPLLESHPCEAVSNNFLGTRVLASAAHLARVRHFVMVSTDKAVRPVSVMGASKRAAEIYVQDLARRSTSHFITVRFGNVLGSSGSVIPIFREQIEKGGPVTVTHPEMMRYFMTIPEAAQLVLQAGSMGRGGEIFLLDMGEPLRIVDLAEEMIRLSGLRPYEDIDIVFSGLRPGEKMHEELLFPEENLQRTPHEKIFVARAATGTAESLVEDIEELVRTSRTMDAPSLAARLRELVADAAQSAGAPDEPAEEPLGETALKPAVSPLN